MLHVAIRTNREQVLIGQSRNPVSYMSGTTKQFTSSPSDLDHVSREIDNRPCF